MSNLLRGIYEQLLTHRNQKQIEDLDSSENIIELEHLEDNLLPDFLTRSLQAHICKSITNLKTREDRYLLANKLLKILLSESNVVEDDDIFITENEKSPYRNSS